jgi:hypothetical protein
MAGMSFARRVSLLAIAPTCLLASACTTPSAPVAVSSAPPSATAPTAGPTPTAASTSATPATGATPPASVSATPTASSPGAALAGLAAKAPATMSATYDLKSAVSGTAGVRIDVVPAGYRVSVTRAGRTATLIVRRGGASTSCSAGKCFTVATGGNGVPNAFDPQVQHAITDYLPIFAASPDELTVGKSTFKATGSCFDVKPSGTGPTPVVAGTYCLDAAGHVTAVDYPTGLLTLVSVNADPTAAVLTPPATPAPIPTATTTHEPTD